MHLLFTSFFIYLSEGALFCTFCLGLVIFSFRFMGPKLRKCFTFSHVTDQGLARFAIFLVVFVAAWSVLFKLSLPYVVRTPKGPLYHGDSQYYALASEGLGAILTCLGLIKVLFKVRSMVHLALSGQDKIDTTSEEEIYQ